MNKRRIGTWVPTHFGYFCAFKSNSPPKPWAYKAILEDLGFHKKLDTPFEDSGESNNILPEYQFYSPDNRDVPENKFYFPPQ